MQSTTEFSVKERIIRMKIKFDAEVYETDVERLEMACLIIATLDIVLRITFVCIALFGTDAAVPAAVWLTDTASECEEYTGWALMILIPVFLIDTTISIVFSVCLVVAVKTRNLLLMKACFIYGMMVQSLALIALIPNLVSTLAGIFSGFGRSVVSLVSEVLATIEMLIVYKTYMKLKRDDELRQLVNMTNVEDKQNTPTALSIL